MTGETEYCDPPAALMGIIAMYLGNPGADQLRADADLMKLGLDSAGVVCVLTDVEEAFSVEFPDETLNRATFETPRALWSVVLGLLDCAG